MYDANLQFTLFPMTKDVKNDQTFYLSFNLVVSKISLEIMERHKFTLLFINIKYVNQVSWGKIASILQLFHIMIPLSYPYAP